MAQFPVLSFKVAFGSNPFDAVPVWTDLGPAGGLGPGGHGFVRSIQTKRGRERLLRETQQFEAGTGTVVLDNRGRQFDPTNTASPYYPNVQPEKLVQVGATWAGTYYPIWTGTPDDWQQDWPGTGDGITTLPMTDLFKGFSLSRLVTTGYLNTVLDDGAAAVFQCSDPVGSTVLANAVPGGPPAGPLQGQNTDPFSTGPPVGTVLGQPGPFGAEPTLRSANFPFPVHIPSTVPVPNGGGWVFEGWASNTSGAAAPGPCGEFFELADSAGRTLFVQMQPLGGPNRLQLTWNGPTGSGLTTTINLDDGINLWQDGLFHYFALVIYGDAAVFQYDGTLIGASQVFSSSPTPIAAPLSFAQLGGGYNNNFNFCNLALYPLYLNETQLLNHYNQGSWPAESTGQRFNRVLQIPNLPASMRNVATGRTLVQATGGYDEAQTKILDYLQKIEQTEQGQCFVAASGALNFQDRYYRYTGGRIIPKAIFGDGPGELPYAQGGVKLNFDRVELFNEIPVQRRNGIAQLAVNPASVTRFTERTMNGLSDLLMYADSDAYFCAQWIVADTAYPSFRVDNLIVDCTASDLLWPVVLSLEIGDVVTVNKHNVPGGGPPLSVNVRIEGIEHQVAAPAKWMVTYHLSLADTSPWLVFDDTVHGTLDGGSRWGW